jgi:hypothetical protein
MWTDNEQCIHHIAAYGFQPSVYEKRHFRRKQVTASIACPPRQKIRTNIADVVDEGIVLNTDEHKISEKVVIQMDTPVDEYDTDRYKSSDGNNKIKPLTFSEFSKLTSDMNHAYSRSSADKQIIAATMMFNIKDILCHTLPSVDNHDIESDCKTYDTILEKSKEILRVYKTAFAQSKQFRANENAPIRVMRPNETEVNTRLRSRPQSMREKAMKKNKAPRTCTFCKSSIPYSHDRNNCPKRIEYERRGTQYTSSNVKTNLRNRIESFMPIFHPVKDPVINQMSATLISKEVKHLIIHKCYATKRSNEYGFLSIISMNFEVSFVDQNGIVTTHHEKQFISGYVLEDLLSALKRSNSRLVIDETSRLFVDELVVFHRRTNEVQRAGLYDDSVQV